NPNLNPIENLWNIVKSNVEKQWRKNLDELERFMEEWEKNLARRFREPSGVYEKTL
ncbi:hypothetical protein C2G38_1951967, partial [Gigaspora rosea]